MTANQARSAPLKGTHRSSGSPPFSPSAGCEMNGGVVSRFFVFALAALLLLGGGCGRSDGQSSSVTNVASTPVTSGGIQSTNYSGYQLSGAPGGFKKVIGSWVVPGIASSTTDTASSTWTGIGGGCANPPDCTVTDLTLIQAGTEQDNRGTPTYFAWWEALPAPQVRANGGLLGTDTFDVLPGDFITVTIDGTSAIVWNITITNQRSGQPHWTFNTSVPYVAAALTTEWIEETPLSVGSGSAGQLALSDFGRVSFSGLSVNGAKPTLDLTQRIVLTDAQGHVLANPSLPSGSGDAFSICFGPAPCD